MDRAELKALIRTSGCARESGEFLFLCDPNWSAAERAQADAAIALAATLPEEAAERGWLCVRTGGTGGSGVKFARHDEHTIAAAVRGFREHFGFTRVNAKGILPLHHVSGLMAWMRCVLTGGEYRALDWKKLEAGENLQWFEDEWVISLVPTQLQRLLSHPRSANWLRSFRTIYVGGGPAWGDLLEIASQAGLAISITYGLTETAAMVTALRPAEFLAGVRSCGNTLPHARVVLSAEGVIHIAGESVFRGYFPEWREAREFSTEDLGQIDERGHLQVVGRRDAVIITGGKKVQPEEVEAVLRSSGEFAEVAVIGVPDHEWGEIVVACYPAGQKPKIARAVRELASYQRPKHFLTVADWPRTELGKLNRPALVAWATAKLR